MTVSDKRCVTNRSATMAQGAQDTKTAIRTIKSTPMHTKI